MVNILLFLIFIIVLQGIFIPLNNKLALINKVEYEMQIVR